ncbi:hypothetical protein ACLINR_003023 [Vibrio parahaemolyticus]
MKLTPYLTAVVSVSCAFGAFAADDSKALLEDALSAAPPTIRDKVTVMDWNNNVLQEGSSQYTCFPTPPQLEGIAPMCMDGMGRRLDEQKTFPSQSIRHFLHVSG